MIADAVDFQSLEKVFPDIGKIPSKFSNPWKTDCTGPVQPWELDPTNRVLINDLDLRVIDSSGTTNYPWILDSQNPSTAATTGDNVLDGTTNFPWVLDPFNPTNAATHGDNILDNIEQVVVENTTTGLYEVVINHKGSLSNGVQDISILISGYQPEDKGLMITDITTVSNDVSQLVWDSVVGSLHTVMSSTNLLNTNGWSELSAPLSIIKEETDWVDDDGASPNVRFYRINQVK